MTANGDQYRIAAPASAAILAAYNEGRKFLSIEFHAVQETRSKSGVREIQKAYLPGAAMVSPTPNTCMATAEIRSSAAGKVWL